MLFKIGVLKNFPIFTRKHLPVFQSLFDQVASLSTCIKVSRKLTFLIVGKKF